MQFVYGSFAARPEDNFRHTGGSMTSRINNGRHEAVIVTLDFGFTLHYAGQAALAQRMREIQAGIRVWGSNVGFLHDDGSKSTIFITSAETSSGTRIKKYPFPDADENNGNYASGLKGSCSFEAEYLPQQYANGGAGGGGGGFVIVAFSEATSMQGNGGKRVIWQEFSSGPPEPYTTADQTLCRATQAGQIVTEANAKDSFGQVRSPLWPQYLVNEAEAITKTNDELGEGKWRCTLAWNYQFEKGGPFQ